MFPLWLIALHAGAPPVISQTVLSVMFVGLGVFLMGIGFGYLTKSRENLLQHRWVLTGAVALSLGAIFSVCCPHLFVWRYRRRILHISFRGNNSPCSGWRTRNNHGNLLCIRDFAQIEPEKTDAADRRALDNQFHNRYFAIPSNV